MKKIIGLLAIVAVVGIGYLVMSSMPDTNEMESKPVEAMDTGTDNTPASSTNGDASNSEAVAHLNAYFEALRAEFPPGGNAAAKMQNVMDGGTKIAQRFFPGNEGPLARSVVQSLTQFAALSPESWEFVSVTETGDATEIVVNFTVGNTSMAQIGMGSSEARYTLQGGDTNWTLSSAVANVQR